MLNVGASAGNAAPAKTRFTVEACSPMPLAWWTEPWAFAADAVTERHHSDFAWLFGCRGKNRLPIVKLFKCLFYFRFINIVLVQILELDVCTF